MSLLQKPAFYRALSDQNVFQKTMDEIHKKMLIASEQANTSLTWTGGLTPTMKEKLNALGFQVVESQITPGEFEISW